MTHFAFWGLTFSDIAVLLIYFVVIIYVAIKASLTIKNNEDYKNKISDIMTVEAEKFKNLLNRGKNYKPKFAQILRFNLWKISAILKKYLYPGDFQYWEL